MCKNKSNNEIVNKVLNFRRQISKGLPIQETLTIESFIFGGPWDEGVIIRHPNLFYTSFLHGGCWNYSMLHSKPDPVWDKWVELQKEAHRNGKYLFF